MQNNNPLTRLVVQVAKNVSGESYHPASIIARKSFGVTILALLGTNIDTSYNGLVDIYANSTTSDTGFLIGRANLSQGVGFATCKISSVYGESSFRKVTAVDPDGKRSSINVGVWFEGDISTFAIPPGGVPSCGSQNIPSNYAALPARNMCGANLAIFNPNNNRSTTAKVWDVGPWVPYKNCGNDKYWNTGNEPWAQQNKGKKRCAICTCDPGATDYTVNGAILDVAPSVLNSVGASSTLVNGLWRFT